MATSPPGAGPSGVAPPARMYSRSSGAQPRMLAGIAVDDQEGEEIQEAQRAGDAEAPAPAEMHDGQRHQRHADHVGEFRRGVEDRCRKRPFLAREPVAGGLRACRESPALPRHPAECAPQRCRRSRWRKRSRRKRAPEERADAADAGDAEAVEDHTGRDLQQRVGPEEAAEQPAEIAGVRPNSCFSCGAATERLIRSK